MDRAKSYSQLFPWQWMVSTYSQQWLIVLTHMCCDLAGSVGSREHWLWDLLFWESFNFYNFGITGQIQLGFSAKCTSPNEDFNHIENWKWHMFDFWLIPLNRITYTAVYRYQNMLCILQNHQFHALSPSISTHQKGNNMKQ